MEPDVSTYLQAPSVGQVVRFSFATVTTNYTHASWLSLTAFNRLRAGEKGERLRERTGENGVSGVPAHGSRVPRFFDASACDARYSTGSRRFSG